MIFAVQQAQKDHQHEHLVRLWTWATVEAGSGEQATSTQYSVLSTPHSDGESKSAAPSSTPAFRMDIVLRADSLTAIMLGMVTFISTLVVIYASGYMHGDPGYWRFFAYVALFVFSMTMLVSVSNFVLLYVFWEGGGPVQLSAHRLLVREAGGRRGRHEGLSGQPRRRLRFRPGRVPALDDLWHAEFP